MLSAAILRPFCKPLEQGARNPSRDEWTVKTALTKADRVFPDFRQRIKGKVVLDYGSGYGYQCVAMVQAGASRVVGLDPMQIAIDTGRRLATDNGVAEKISFIRDPSELAGKVDAVLSQNSFEHFPDPERELRTMASLLAPGGKLFICFGPPWYAPRGSHMSYFCYLPWVNLLFPERAVMKVRALYRDDGARRYADVPGGLNKMSIAKWEGLVRLSGLTVEYRKYHSIKNIDLLADFPVLRELFINDVTAILTKLQ